MPGHVRARKDKNGKVRKRADGSTIWQARWRPADDPSDRYREERNFKTKKDGERWIASRDSDVLRGAYAPARKGEVRFEAVLGDVRAKWDLKLEPKTRAGYEAILSRWLIGERDPLHPRRQCRFRGAKVGAITTKHVQEFVNEVWVARAPNTVRRIYGVLKAVLDEAARAGYIAANPCASVEMPSKKRHGIRRSKLYLEAPELRTLVAALPAHWRLPVLLDGSCGLRAGEVWALRRRDLDLLHSELAVRFALKEINSSAAALDTTKGLLIGHPKSAASRRALSLPAGLVPLLETHLSLPGTRSPRGYAVAREDPEDENRADLDWTRDPADPDRLLFVTPSGYPVRHNNFYKKVFKPAVKRALPPRLHALRFHDLRHTCAALSLASGGNLTDVQERLGHENYATTADLYGKRVRSRDAAIADAVGASIFTEPEPENVTPLRSAGG